MGSLWLDLNLLHIVTEKVLMMLPKFRISEELSSRKIPQDWGILAAYSFVIIPLDVTSRCPVWDQISILPINSTLKKCQPC